jgi:outer membrane protein OmpA-like peptidoglycan-associated protein
MKKFLLLLIVLTSGISITYSQIDFGNLEEEQIYRKGSKYNRWSITAGFGPVIYYPDVIDYTLFPSDNWKMGPSFSVARHFGRSWSVDAQFIMADMYGQKYNRYFEGDFREMTVNLSTSLNQLILGGPMRDRWNVYLKLGIGVNYFRSAMREQGTDRFLEVDEIFGGGGYPNAYADWKPTDFLVMGYDRENPSKEIKRESEIVIPMGIGARYRINKSFDVGLETTLRNLGGDNLDVDMTGADNDSYIYTAVSLTYKLGKKNKRHSSWTYKDFNLSYERDRSRDPLAQKLDSLKNELAMIAASDSVVGDTTVIQTESIIRKESFASSVFFDFDKSEISSSAHRQIANVARFMRKNPSVRMLVQGYCDDRGSAEYNVKLSQRRCMAVVDVLVKDYGMDASRFDVEPKGKQELLSDTRALAPRGVHLVNRRVDIFQITE